MTRKTNNLAGIAGIILLSSAAAFMGFGLYNTGKLAGQATAPVSESEPKHTQVPERSREPFSDASGSAHLANAVVSTPASRTVTSSSSPSQTNSSYLQSASNPDKRVVHQAPQSGSSHQEKLAIYRSLQETCQRWTKWYNKDRSSHSAVQMNVACREAADYGRKELNLNTTARRVNPDARRPQSNSAGGGAVLVGNNSGRNESPRCQNLRRELDHIQSRLRAGYKVEEGERLKKRRRQIRDQIQQHC